ncbi:HtaA domain-containing protein [Streptomyces litchfieldiae]|uniref:HtaA domain-containing protein n=1 Tax=Streptomyces litchfieldiae TaxID=3075543 RepID=A0ABU2MSH6_9ACTN|nr:HtaA domain-containing protein [Streptomyces sp. DSM 44938]MDT0344582.1 HtaA domain-containing protein [Streptomyces sp. DSM 44938]
MTSATRPRPIRRGALLLATATATVLSITSLAAPAFAEDTQAAPIGLVDGTLDWGVKESFRRYITGPIAGGSATTADGAETNQDGSYRFTGGTGTYDLTTHAVDTAFDGSVHFEGHHGALDLKLSELRVVTEGTSGSIVADVTVAGTTTEDVEFAALDLTGVAPGQGEGGAMVFAGIPATLTAGGAEAFEFNGSPMYAEGTALDPATLTVSPAPDDGEEPDPNPGDDEGDPNAPGGGGGDQGSGQDGGSDTDPDATAGTVHDGNLDWGVKESFRGYVTGPIANGSVELAAGATEITGGYRFPNGTGAYDTEAGTLATAFDGSVRFVGHEGTLDLAFSEFAVDITGSGAELVADVSSKDRETGEVTEYDGIAVAELDVPADALTPVNDVVTLDAVPATLTAEGAEAFAGFYESGEALDPVTVTVAVTEDADLPSGGDDTGGTGDAGGAAGTGGLGTQTGAGGGALAATGGGSDTAVLLAAAAALTATGAAAVTVATRRRRAAGADAMTA